MFGFLLTDAVRGGTPQVDTPGTHLLEQPPCVYTGDIQQFLSWLAFLCEHEEVGVIHSLVSRPTNVCCMVPSQVPTYIIYTTNRLVKHWSMTVFSATSNNTALAHTIPSTTISNTKHYHIQYTAQAHPIRSTCTYTIASTCTCNSQHKHIQYIAQAHPIHNTSTYNTQH